MFGRLSGILAMLLAGIGLSGLTSCEKKENPSSSRSKLEELVTRYQSLTPEARKSLDEDRGFKGLVGGLKMAIDASSQSPIQVGPKSLCHTLVPLALVSGSPPAPDNCFSDLSKGSDLLQLYSSALHEKWPDFDAILLNAGSVKSSLAAGQHYYGDFIRVVPYRDRLIGMEVKGGRLVAALEEFHQNLAKHPQWTGNYPYFSGVRYSVDLSSAATPKLFDIQRRDVKSGKWLPLKPDDLLKVLLPDYLANLKDSPFQSLGNPMADSESLKADPRFILFEKMQKLSTGSDRNPSEYSLQEIRRSSTSLEGAKP